MDIDSSLAVGAGQSQLGRLGGPRHARTAANFAGFVAVAAGGRRVVRGGLGGAPRDGRRERRRDLGRHRGASSTARDAADAADAAPTPPTPPTPTPPTPPPRRRRRRRRRRATPDAHRQQHAVALLRARAAPRRAAVADAAHTIRGWRPRGAWRLRCRSPCSCSGKGARLPLDGGHARPPPPVQGPSAPHHQPRLPSQPDEQPPPTQHRPHARAHHRGDVPSCSASTASTRARGRARGTRTRG